MARIRGFPPLRMTHSSSGCVDFPEGTIRRTDEATAEAVCDKMELAWDRLRRMTRKDPENIRWHLHWMRLTLDEGKPPEIRFEELYFGSSLLMFDEDGGAAGVYLHPHEGQRLREPPWDLHGDLRIWPWFSFSEGGVPGGIQDCRAGWIDPASHFSWSYVQEDDGRTRIEVTWSLQGVPADWQERVVQAVKQSAKCQVEGVGECILHADIASGELRFRGSLPLTPADPRPLVRKVALASEPLVVRQPGGADPVREKVVHRPSSPILRWTASVHGRATRFIADDDLDEPFETVVATQQRILLPSSIPARPAEGWLWDLRVEDCGTHREEGQEVRLWRITAVPAGEGSPAGTWLHVPWTGRRLSWFLDGDGGDEVTLWQTTARNARLGWEIAEIDGLGSALCLVRPVWRTPDLPVSGGSLNGEEGAGLLNEVAVEIAGISEVFQIDGESELPEKLLAMDPEQWVAFGAAGERISDPEALGHVGGAVWWRLPGSDGGGRRSGRPADWGAGSSPVLVIQKGEAPRAWGGLWVVENLPEDSEEIVPVLLEDQGRFVVAPPQETSASLWISFRGFIDRYDRREILLPTGEVAVAWVGRVGLPLFPHGSDHLPVPGTSSAGGPDEAPRPAPPTSLLRSMAPLFARVEKEDRDTIALEIPESARASRPLLRLGELLCQAPAHSRLRVEDGTLLRLAIGAELPREGWIQAPSGDRLSLPRRSPGQAAWLTLEPLEGAEPLPRVLLCWDDRGWRFRGFYVLRQAETRLGSVDLPEGGEALLAFASFRPGRFSLSVFDQAGGPRFSWQDAPVDIRSQVSDEELAAWYAKGLSSGYAPGPLQALDMKRTRQPGSTLISFFPVKLTEVRSSQALSVRVWWSPASSPPEVPAAEEVRSAPTGAGGEKRNLSPEELEELSGAEPRSSEE